VGCGGVAQRATRAIGTQSAGIRGLHPKPAAAAPSQVAMRETTTDGGLGPHVETALRAINEGYIAAGVVRGGRATVVRHQVGCSPGGRDGDDRRARRVAPIRGPHLADPQVFVAANLITEAAGDKRYRVAK